MARREVLDLYGVRWFGRVKKDDSAADSHNFLTRGRAGWGERRAGRRRLEGWKAERKERPQRQSLGFSFSLSAFCLSRHLRADARCEQGDAQPRRAQIWMRLNGKKKGLSSGRTSSRRSV